MGNSNTVLYGQNAAEIIEIMDEKMRGDSNYAEMTMTIERPRYTRDVSMRSWSLGNDFSLIVITAPARDQGTAFLKRDSEIWNYVPNIDRTIKMPPSMMSQSWMGSDFTNDDLVRESSTVEDYVHRIVESDAELEGREAWIIELIPKPETPVVWGKVLIWVDKEEFIQLRVENYDQSDELANHIEFTDLREFDNRMIASKLILIPADKPDQRTIMTYDELQFDIDIDESFFTQQNMRRIR
tara:strand:+ start:1954 stop:2673 length:720 start_codon:yes stop_codon:yes gene_type:complete